MAWANVYPPNTMPETNGKEAAYVWLRLVGGCSYAVMVTVAIVLNIILALSLAKVLPIISFHNDNI